MRDIVKELFDAFENDTRPWDATIYSRAALEIQTLRALAEDLYITLVNEIGSTTAGRNYQEYLENVSGSPFPAE